MAEGRVKSTELSAIAAAIRSKNGSSTVYKPAEMAAAIAALPSAPTLQSLSVSTNGTYTPDDGVDGFSRVDVEVPTGGAREGGICPAVVSTIPYSVSTSGLANRSNGTWNIITEGFLPASAVGHQVLVLAETRSLSGITVSGFTQLYSAGLLTAFYGTLAEATSIEISATSQCYFSIVELDDRYEPAVYTNLCAALDNGATVNTSELKTANAFKVSAKLPSGYGILGLATNYDYSSADYRPSTWEVLNRLIGRPEICFRRPSGEYDAGGTAFFIKQNPASYNQYFLRGSVNGKIEDDTLNDPSGLTSVSSINDFKDVPTWNVVNLSIVFIRLQERS